MRALLLICMLLVGLAPAFGSAVFSGESIEQLEARAYCVPSSVQIGEPFSLFLDIVHDPEQRILLHTPEGEEQELFGDSWELLEPSRSVRLPLDDGSGKQLTQVRWRLFALEPGDFELPTLGADCVGAGALQRVEAPSATLIVSGELGEGEDEARATIGFREVPDTVRGPLKPLVIGALVLFAALLVFFVVWLVRRFKPAKKTPAPPTPLARLQDFDPADESAVRELYFGVSRIVRDALDPAREVGAGGTTDQEWLTQLGAREGLRADLLERTARLLEGCAEVKYGGATPTRWAAEETLKEANAICALAERELPEEVSA